MHWLIGRHSACWLPIASVEGGLQQRGRPAGGVDVVQASCGRNNVGGRSALGSSEALSASLPAALEILCTRWLMVAGNADSQPQYWPRVRTVLPAPPEVVPRLTGAAAHWPDGLHNPSIQSARPCL